MARMQRESAAPPVQLTVVVPAYRCAPMLRACLDGLVQSDLPRTAWELIVVDDGSTDDTATVASRTADRVLRVPDGPRGPAHARNLGALAARGDVLVFVDADVVVAPATLRGFAELLAAEPELTAAFGAYDDEPADPALVSRYRNLLHHHVHVRHAGEAETFWSGCGAVRRDAFLRVGGFDAHRYQRPQVEDIELGYRLRDAGGRIRLMPTLTGKHLKHWSLAGMLRSDFRDRAVPWMQLLLERRSLLSDTSLNLAPWEKLFTAAAGLAAFAMVVGILTRSPVWFWLAAASLCLIVAGNVTLLRFFASRHGWIFALGTVPLRVSFYLVGALGAGWAVLSGGWLRRQKSAPQPLRAEPATAR
jgi:glycosyltransferase involved in cell wall biosynthesis